jgi:hypothetical protein
MGPSRVLPPCGIELNHAFNETKYVLSSATINAQHLPINPFALVRSQEAHHLGNIDGITASGQRRHVRHNLDG